MSWHILLNKKAYYLSLRVWEVGLWPAGHWISSVNWLQMSGWKWISQIFRCFTSYCCCTIKTGARLHQQSCTAGSRHGLGLLDSQRILKRIWLEYAQIKSCSKMLQMLGHLFQMESCWLVRHNVVCYSPAFNWLINSFPCHFILVVNQCWRQHFRNKTQFYFQVTHCTCWAATGSIQIVNRTATPGTINDWNWNFWISLSCMVCKK